MATGSLGLEYGFSRLLEKARTESEDVEHCYFEIASYRQADIA